MLRYLTLAGLILICLPAFATAELLDLSVWCELEPMAEDTGGSPLSREEARKRQQEPAVQQGYLTKGQSRWGDRRVPTHNSKGVLSCRDVKRRNRRAASTRLEC